MICPSCGENNSENFRFCGMCGTSLEARRPAGAPRVATPSDAVRTAPGASAEPRRAAVSENVPAQGGAPVTGPSFLGLNQPAATKRADVFDPAPDTMRDQSFSGLDSFFAPEEPRTGRRIFLLLVLLGALGAGGWWTYSYYLRTNPALQNAAANPGLSQAPAANSAPQAEAPSGVPSSAPSQAPQPSQSSQPSQTPAGSGPDSSQAAAGAATPPPPSQSANASPAQSGSPGHGEGAGEDTSSAGRSASSAAPAETKPARRQKTTHADTKPAAAPHSAASASTESGDAAFRKGVAYLYGRGVRENCAEAMKYLKAASGQQNAKARSTFGTMYATGHCVPRDLPTSYSWFALALRVDPNNQILEKDLTAVWNQMTPPERQMATKMKE